AGATLRGSPLRQYAHKDLGLVVDLGGRGSIGQKEEQMLTDHSSGPGSERLQMLMRSSSI
ncbi:hypothetical protein, partial [Streptomyces sp. NPDC059656]|uniref:hypothetical protein n=1 Tax=Streptomyces sp. NPDC059656 TaxID=3346898 RepID=UPI0036AF6FAD